MKASQFNVFFQHEGHNVGFNGYTQEFIIIDPLLLDLYDVGKKKRDFKELEEVHSEFYQFLIQQGFLVDDELNEFEAVKELSRQIDNNDSHFSLIVNPTMNCNFKCWYCYETHIKDSKMDENTIAATTNFAKKVIADNKSLKSFSLSWFGGEPLLYFDKVIKPILISVSTYCKEMGVHFNSGMTTNGLLINQKMLDVCKEYGLSGFQITLDGVKEQHDKVRFISEGRGSYDKIVENIRLIVKNQLYANVRINCSVETLNGMNEIIDDFGELTEEDRKYVHIDIHKVWQVQEDLEPAINETRFHYRDKGYTVRGGIYDTVVNSCYADKRNHATINYNGEVFKCTARDFTSSSSEGLLKTDGSISWNEKFEKRMNAKFNNRPCRECRILPICGGGCSQQALEHEGIDYCIHDFDEDVKTQQVVNKFLATIA